MRQTPTKRRGLLPVVALIAVAGVVAASTVTLAQTEQRLRIAARHLADGRTEVALQRLQDDGEWGDRLLPSERFVAPRSTQGRWLASSPVTVATTHGPQELRIAARRSADGLMEVALQQHRGGDAWGPRILPALRVVTANAPVGRWLNSSPLHEPQPRSLPSAATLLEGFPPPLPAAGLPRAVISPTGVPVAVIGRAGDGYLVRTPCGNAAEITTGEAIDEARVVLDPGHGGRSDHGAWGPNGLIEKDLNLTLSQAILAELADRGIPAATTRTADYDTLLSVRAAFADALRADALISIHHNAPTQRLGDSPGAEVYVQSIDDETPRAASERLGGLLYEEITTMLSMFAGVSWSRLPTAGVLRVLLPDGGDAYGMIRRPAVPAVLVEYGYLSNRSEAELFATDEYISAAAFATADAIEAYLSTDRPGTGFVERPRRFDPYPAPSRCAETRLE